VKAAGKRIECAPGIALPQLWDASYQWQGQTHDIPIPIRTTA